jgi:hypothetical protein
VVAGLEVEPRRLAHDPHDLGVLLGEAVGRVRVREVGQADQQVFDPALGLGELLLQGLDLVAEGIRLRDRVAGLLAGALGPGDALGEPLLPGAPLLDLRQEGAAARVQLEQPVDLGGRTPAREGGLDALRLAADQLEV